MIYVKRELADDIKIKMDFFFEEQVERAKWASATDCPSVRPKSNASCMNPINGLC